MQYYYINKEWMLSPTARRVYRSAATASLMLFFILWVLMFPVEIPHSILPIVKLFLFAGVVGTTITLVAMEYFLFRFDTSPAWKQVFWFCVMMFPPLGPALYCFIVYSHSDVLSRFALQHGENQP